MDFFKHQDQAKRRTFLLVLLYCLGLFGLAVAVGIGALVFCAAVEAKPDEVIIVTLFCVGGVLLLVIGGSLFKTAKLSHGGGIAVAESLGGRIVSPSTTNPGERRLYNVVEEMALAAGVPVPTLYIMDEQSINAFAAGFSPNAAVIGVNRGTIELLTRDELQGVIAHEFSHILNGDMRMNMRLIGILFGLQLVALVGYYTIRLIRFFPGGGSRNSGGGGRGGGKGGGGQLILIILAVGVTLMVIGYIGVFFSALIRAAISRQREFLADASAVQFTRNPDGISGALKKIGCVAVGSSVSSARAAEMSHLFFGNASELFSLGGLLATHPDLTKRIRRIEPRFDGTFPKKSEIVTEDLSQSFANKRKNAEFLSTPSSKQAVMEHIGELNIPNVLAAGALLQAIPQPVTESSNNPLTAQAVFFALLLCPDESIRKKQIFQIQAVYNQLGKSPFLQNETQRLYPQICTLPEAEKIPLAQRVSASLREMNVTQYKKFVKAVDMLIAADQKMSLFEYTIKAMLLRDLDIHFGLTRQLRVRYSALHEVHRSVVAVVSYLAYSGHDNQQETLGAFAASMKILGLSNSILSPNEMSVQQFDNALRVLAETSPTLKKKIFESFMTCVWFDGKITPTEAGLIRAIAAMLAIPMPVLA